MPRTFRELIADGERNAALRDKRLADDRYSTAFTAARLAEQWEQTIGRGFPFFDYTRRGMWIPKVRAQPTASAGPEDGE